MLAKMLANCYYGRRGKEVITITIREIRTTILRMSMRELGEKLGIKRNSYYLKEVGQRKFTAEEILKICKMANFDPMNLEI